MDTTLKRYRNKICFRTRDPAEAPIDAYWLSKKKKKTKKHKKRRYIPNNLDRQANSHMASIGRELKHSLA